MENIEICFKNPSFGLQIYSRDIICTLIRMLMTCISSSSELISFLLTTDHHFHSFIQRLFFLPGLETSSYSVQHLSGALAKSIPFQHFSYRLCMQFRTHGAWIPDARLLVKGFVAHSSFTECYQQIQYCSAFYFVSWKHFDPLRFEWKTVELLCLFQTAISPSAIFHFCPALCTLDLTEYMFRIHFFSL